MKGVAEGAGGGSGRAAWCAVHGERTRPVSRRRTPHAVPAAPRTASSRLLQDQARLLHETALLLALAHAASLPHVLLGRPLPPLPRGVAEPARPRHREEVSPGHDPPLAATLHPHLRSQPCPHLRPRPRPQVKIQPVRPPLGTFKAELTEALRLGDEAAASAISQAGFKQSTWWEDNDQDLDISFDWRR